MKDAIRQSLVLTPRGYELDLSTVLAEISGDLSIDPTGVVTIPSAVPGTKGLMPGSDKTKLDLMRTTQMVYILSAQIDWVAGTDVILIPSTPGYVFLPIAFRSIISQASGTYSGLATMKGGNNASNDNLIASTPTNPAAAAFTAALSAVPVFGSTTNIGSTNASLIDLATPAVLKITTPATGTNLVLKGYILSQGQLVRISDLA